MTVPLNLREFLCFVVVVIIFGNTPSIAQQGSEKSTPSGSSWELSRVKIQVEDDFATDSLSKYVSANATWREREVTLDGQAMLQAFAISGEEFRFSVDLTLSDPTPDAPSSIKILMMEMSEEFADAYASGKVDSEDLLRKPVSFVSATLTKWMSQGKLHASLQIEKGVSGPHQNGNDKVGQSNGMETRICDIDPKFTSGTWTISQQLGMLRFDGPGSFEGFAHAKVGNLWMNFAIVQKAGKNKIRRLRLETSQLENPIDRGLALTVAKEVDLANEELNSGKQKEAITRFGSILVDAEKAWGLNSFCYTRVLAGYCEALRNDPSQNSTVELIASLEKLIKVDSGLLSPDHPRLNLTKWNLAKAKIATGQLPLLKDAIPLLVDCLSQSSKLYGEFSVEVAGVYLDLSRAYGLLSENDVAYKSAANAYARFKVMPGANVPDKISSILQMATLERRMGLVEEAEKNLKEALDLLDGSPIPAPKRKAQVLSILANLRATKGDTGQAIDLYSQGLEVLHDLPENALKSAGQMEFLANRSAMYIKNSDFNSASSDAHKAYEIFRKHPDPKNLVVLYSMSRVHLWNLKFASAEALIKEGIAISEDAFGRNHVTTVHAMTELGILLENQWRFQEASEVLQDAAIIMNSIPGFPLLEKCDLYGPWAVALNEIGESERAIGVLDDSLKIQSLILPPADPNRVRTTVQKAACLSSCNRDAEALQLLDELLALITANEKSIEASRDMLLIRKIGLLAKLKRFDDVGEIEKKLATSTLRTLPNYQLYFDWLDIKMADLNEDARIHKLTRMVEHTDTQFQNASINGLDQSILRDNLSPRSLLIQLLLESKNAKEAWKQWNLGLAAGLTREFDQKYSSAEITRIPSDSSVSEFQKHLGEGEAIIGWVSGEPNRAVILTNTGEPIWIALAEHSDSLMNDIQAVAKRLSRTSLPNESGQKSQTTRNSLSLEEAIAKLEPSLWTPIAERLQSEKIRRLYVCPSALLGQIPVEVFSKQDFVISYIPSPSMLVRLRSRPKSGNKRLFGVAVADYSSQRRIASKLPIENGILVISTVTGSVAEKAGFQQDDVILRINEKSIKQPTELLDKLATAKSNNSSLRFTVWRAGNLIDITVEKLDPSNPMGLRFNNMPAEKIFENRRNRAERISGIKGGAILPNLSGTLAELNHLSHEGSRMALTEGEATDTRVNEMGISGKLKDYGRLHFALHGESFSDSPFASRIVMARDTRLDGLYEPSNPFSDGYIVAQEIRDSWILDADLVTLSACDTGLGTLSSGEGYLGFCQAFLVAGSRNVVVSRWKADDLATTLLMIQFYKETNSSSSKNTAIALHNAKKWLKELTPDQAVDAKNACGLNHLRIPAEDALPFASPKYWAAFILVGSGN